MIRHPWTELQVLIKEKWFTQKAFASILWKKVSEVNELLKWKRNITIQRDYLLHQSLWTPIKYWILKQVDYDYSLINIEDIGNQTDNFKQDKTYSSPNEKETQKSGEIAKSSIDQWTDKWQTEEIQSVKKSDEDYEKRARIFKSF